MTDLFERVIGYYSNLFDCCITGVGTYIPTGTQDIAFHLRSLLESGELKKEDLFLDAGSGDGRVVALAHSLGIRSCGVDYDDTLVRRSRSHFDELFDPSEGRPQIFQGDFTCDQTYAPTESDDSITFSDFTFFYNYDNGEEELVKKISQESSSGTKLLFHGPKKTFKGLNLVRIVEHRVLNFALHQKP